jgi:hypothetical protein
MPEPTEIIPFGLFFGYFWLFSFKTKECELMMMNGSFLSLFYYFYLIKRSVAQPLTPGAHCLVLPSAPPGSLNGGLDLDLLTSLNYMFEVYIKVRIWFINAY